MSEISMSRRGLLTAGLAATLPLNLPQANPRRFRAVHMTDLHMRSGNGAADGIRLAAEKIAALNPRPDFILAGGDTIERLRQSTRAYAETMVRTLEESLKPLEMPVHHAMGNHDILGWSEENTERKSAPGKKFFEEKVMKAPLYRSFDHQGWHFVILDSIRLKDDGGYDGFVDDNQMAWLKSDLEKLAPRTPVVIMSHVPVLTAYALYADGAYRPPTGEMLLRNGKELHELLGPHNVKLVLQGHTHVRESVVYAGRQHVTSGAVCGSWWSGKRFGIDPEGFSILDFSAEDAQVEYAATGWVARG